MQEKIRKEILKAFEAELKELAEPFGEPDAGGTGDVLGDPPYQGQ